MHNFWYERIRYSVIFVSAISASHSFPYVKKRILVVYQRDEELNPIEVAIDEMRKKVAELNEVVNHPAPDFKKLQLKLQGSVSVTVSVCSCHYAPVVLHLTTCTTFTCAQDMYIPDSFWHCEPTSFPGGNTESSVLDYMPYGTERDVPSVSIDIGISYNNSGYAIHVVSHQVGRNWE